MRNPEFNAWDRKNKKWAFKGFHVIGEVSLFDLLKQYKIEEYANLTLVQYIGIKDKNDKKVFEDDIIKMLTTYPMCLKCINDNSPELDVTKAFCPNCGEKITESDHYEIGKVVYESVSAGFIVEEERQENGYRYIRTDFRYIKDFEVIGNTHENPELIEEL